MQGFVSLNPPTAFLEINLLGIPLFLVIYPRIYLEISLMSVNGGQWLNKLLFINISEYYAVIKNEELCMSWHSNTCNTKLVNCKMCLYVSDVVFGNKRVNIFFNLEEQIRNPCRWLSPKDRGTFSVCAVYWYILHTKGSHTWHRGDTWKIFTDWTSSEMKCTRHIAWYTVSTYLMIVFKGVSLALILI